MAHAAFNIMTSPRIRRGVAVYKSRPFDLDRAHKVDNLLNLLVTDGGVAALGGHGDAGGVVRVICQASLFDKRDELFVGLGCDEGAGGDVLAEVWHSLASWAVALGTDGAELCSPGCAAGCGCVASSAACGEHDCSDRNAKEDLDGMIG